MNPLTTLTISPQGQITIPKDWRKYLSLEPGKKVLAQLKIQDKSRVVTLVPDPKNWADYVAGLGQDVWNMVDVDEYLTKERDSWDM